MKNQAIIFIILAVLAIGGVVYVSSQTKPNSNEQIQSSAKQEASPSISTTGEIKTFAVEGKPFEFNPKEIRVKKGDRVKITFTNTQGFHNLTIDKLGIKTRQIAAGQSDTIEFVADRVGTFEYYCGVGNHRDQGMVGTLIVEE